MSSGDSSRPSDVTTAAEEVARTLIESAAVDGASDTAPQLAARFIQVRELGRGGMGRVDEVFDRTLGRAVAQKTLLPGGGEGRAMLLVAEAQTCAQLEHPSIVPVYELGCIPGGEPFYTMRSVRGPSLRDVLRTKTGPDAWPLARLLGVFRQVCLAVDYAHSRGVVHRDLKPGNIIVGQFGEVYVLDWGIASVLEGSDVRRSNIARLVAGSPGYMAPEQAKGDVDARADVFSLGVILFEILSGTVWRSGASLRHANAQVTDAFDALVSRCLAAEREERPASARVLAEAVDAFLDGERARAEREAEADAFVAEGLAARETYLAREAEAARHREEAALLLDSVQAWESVERKQPAWDLVSKANVLVAEGARAIAHAQAAFTSALGRVADHPAARRGLAGLHFDQFEAAEARRDLEQTAQHLELARAYDDGALALEVANEGELVVHMNAAIGFAEILCAEVRARGALLELGCFRALELGARLRMKAGSYLVVLRTPYGDERRFPLVVKRARVHTLTVRSIPALPPGMLHVPSGPYLTAAKGEGLVAKHVDDFAIGQLPVTLRAYVAFLDQLDPAERARRIPHLAGHDPGILRVDGEWRIAEDWIEGDGRKRVPPARELDLPVSCISWFDAAAYAAWLTKTTGLGYRLPTSVEWDKAMRGADGRAFPMATSLDPSFAKLRESRPEAAQPEPVGAFPLDVSAYGVRDLAGGVGDWTSSFADGQPAPVLADEATNLHDGRQAVWCGGAWSTSATAPRLHYSQMPRHRVSSVGFRVALALEGASAELTAESMARPSV